MYEGKPLSDVSHCRATSKRSVRQGDPQVYWRVCRDPSLEGLNKHCAILSLCPTFSNSVALEYQVI